MQPRQRGSLIASAVAKCFKSFNTVEEILDNADDHPELRTALIDCLGQFRVWSGNTGAHQTGNTSLDHRLRDVPSVSKSTWQLLSSLDGLIIDVRSLLIHPRLSSDIHSHKTDSSDSESSEDEVAGGPSEAKQIFHDMSELIASLHRLSVSIRNPIVTRRYKKDSSLDTSFFESYDIDHVRHKFPGAPMNLACRLGKANSRRRQWLKSRQAHVANLAQDLEDDYTSTALSKTTASKGESIFDSHAGADIDESSTSTSVTSFSMSTDACHKTGMPSMPKEAENEQPFECPYCHGIERVAHSYAWKKHVYSDLRPYLCTFEDCASPNETYENRHAWFHHELQNHRRSWACDVHCEMIFGSEDLMVDHIHEHSPIALTVAQARASARMCMIPINEMVVSNCPICDMTISVLSKFRSHLGRHLEELALFVLPATDDGSDGEDDLISSCDEIDEAMEKMVLKKGDIKDVNEDTTEIIASQLTKTNDPLQDSKHSPSTSSEGVEFSKIDAEPDHQVDEEDDEPEKKRPENSERMEFSKIDAEPDHQVDEEDGEPEKKWPENSEEVKFSKMDAEPDHQVDEEDDEPGKKRPENSPSASSKESKMPKSDAKADHQIDETYDKTEEQWSSGTVSAFSDIMDRVGDKFGSGHGRFPYKWFCCGCGDGPKNDKKEIKCVGCNHMKCFNCHME